MSSPSHPSAVGAALFLLARKHFPWAGWPVNEGELFRAAGVSMEEVDAAKQDVLERLDGLLEARGPHPTSLAVVTGLIEKFRTQNPDAVTLDKMGQPVYSPPYLLHLVLLSANSAKLAPGCLLSLRDISKLTEVPLSQLEEIHQAVRDAAQEEANRRRGKANSQATSKPKPKKRR